jgi:hypothetical protein
MRGMSGVRERGTTLTPLGVSVLYEHPGTCERRAFAVRGDTYDELSTDDLGRPSLIRRRLPLAEWRTFPHAWWLQNGFEPSLVRQIPDEWTRGVQRFLALEGEGDASATGLGTKIERSDLVVVRATPPESWQELARAGAGVRFEYRDRADLKHLASFGSHLKEIVSGDGPLEKYKPVNDASLALVARATSLRWLDLRYRAEISDEGLSALRSLEHLEQLALPGPGPGGLGLRHLSCENTLKTLVRQFSGTSATVAEVRNCVRFRALERLTLHLNQPTPRAVEELRAATKLRHLWLWVTGPLRAVDALSSLSLLEDLVLSADGIEGELAPALATLKKLTSLRIHGAVTDAVAEAVCSAKKLRFVHMGESAKPGARAQVLTDAALRALSRSKTIHGLHLRGRFTDVGLRELARLKKLGALSIGGAFTTEGFAPLAALESLRHLEVSSPSEGTAKGIALLKSGGHLTSLRVSHPRGDAARILKRAFGKHLVEYEEFGTRGLQWRDPQLERPFRRIQRSLLC